MIYFIAYNTLKQKEIYPINEIERRETLMVTQTEEEQTKRKIISDERLFELKSSLNRLMENEEPYLDTELNLINLAKQMNISSNQLSYVINTGFDENFYSYINRFRVKKAKKLLRNNSSLNLSIIGIAYESGFSSKTTFNTIFKKNTGLTPSEFKKKGSDL
ncbi:helix-turn-helix domain-containing protein [Halosquirtibacter xylanolyticus]|uniref:helix-turn-helix domain-containing protein n=1 Tax=Halosquirtibacter xylanolyticus TaxID=3374599 RepID=UPI003747874C|nr:helix-turn-helix domain-containing protein [Prolixibacteraceae bacterium]